MLLSSFYARRQGVSQKLEPYPRLFCYTNRSLKIILKPKHNSRHEINSYHILNRYYRMKNLNLKIKFLKTQSPAYCHVFAGRLRILKDCLQISEFVFLFYTMNIHYPNVLFTITCYLHKWSR